MISPRTKVTPITYVNSTAAIKAFCGLHQGTTCTSSNAREILEWAFKQGEKLFFFPDQHLGRNTAFEMGIPLEKMVLWDPFKERGGHSEDAVRNAKVLLWKGHCSVHMNFLPEYVDQFRQIFPGIKVIVHPECMFETVQKADLFGSTSKIIKTIEAAPSGSVWAVGTENHLVERLQKENPDKTIHILSPFTCQCATMFRNSPADLLHVLEGLLGGEVINRITVPRETAKAAKIALERMLGTHKI